MNSGVTVMLKKQCEHLVDQIKMEYSMNEGGSSLESLIEFCSKNGIEGYLSKEFHLPPITKEAEEIYLRLSNFSAHKTLLILCSNGKDRYQQKAS
jgi:hypothetical protein